MIIFGEFLSTLVYPENVLKIIKLKICFALYFKKKAGSILTLSVRVKPRFEINRPIHFILLIDIIVYI